MAKVKIKQPSGPSGSIVGTSIEVDGRLVTHVQALELFMGVDGNKLLIRQTAVPDVEVDADVDVTKVCRCCGGALHR